MPKLQRKTKNLIIRPYELEDHAVWKEALLSLRPSQNAWNPGPKPASELTKAKYRSLLSHQKKEMAKDDSYRLGVFERKTGAFVGLVAIMNVVRSISQTAFLGYTLNNTFWGRGYGKESVLACIDIAFRDLGLHRIEAGIEPNNRRSIMLARSIGLRKEGMKKRCIYARGEWQDLVIYSATCEEFGIKWKGEAKPIR